MLTLFRLPDRIVSWSDFSLLLKTVRKLNRICRKIFSRFYRIFHLSFSVSGIF